MFDNQRFKHLVEQDRPVGEVVGVNRFMVVVKGLAAAPVRSSVLFENGQRGIVREVAEDLVTVLNLSSESLVVGTLAVLDEDSLSIAVGEGLVGRIVSALGQPIDDRGQIKLTQTVPIFAGAPGIIDRAILKDQLETGVAIVDTLFPIVMGQRIAILGDSKSGKSTFLRQLTVNQASKGHLVIYVMIAKPKIEIDRLVSELIDTGAIQNTIVMVADLFDSLAQSYLAPYAACAIGEYFWHQGRDVVMVYDDLTNHAKVYREISLISRANPGRDSYPGDMFYAHSSLLERAGKLKDGGKTMTAIPAVLTPGDDITAYLPTSVMSITDGQIIFDLETYRQGIRPAVNAGLSVSRVGGRAQTDHQKAISGQLFKKLADYRQAAEFSHFGSELALQSRADLELGQQIYEAFKQWPDELFPMMAQNLMMDVILHNGGKVKVDVARLKKQALSLAPTVTSEAQYEAAIAQLLGTSTIQTTPPPAATPKPPVAPTPPGATPVGGKP